MKNLARLTSHRANVKINKRRKGSDMRYGKVGNQEPIVAILLKLKTRHVSCLMI